MHINKQQTVRQTTTQHTQQQYIHIYQTDTQTATKQKHDTHKPHNNKKHI